MITIVSGVPRSGTSMLMQMLAAGGMDMAVDHIRQADEDNPKGYFEYEKVKKLEQDASWLDEVEGKAIKVISYLLPRLPEDRAYKIIFMERDLNEVVRSQNNMLKRRNQSGSKGDDAKMVRLFEEHLTRIKTLIGRTKNMDVLYLAHRDVLDHPPRAAEEIADFLDRDLDREAMAECVDPELYRQGKSLP